MTFDQLKKLIVASAAKQLPDPETYRFSTYIVCLQFRDLNITDAIAPNVYDDVFVEILFNRQAFMGAPAQWVAAL